MKTRWYKNAVIYQIYPRSFCDSNGDGIGDIKGIISKLDYLGELGVNAIWLSPCFKSPNDDNGYDISDYRDIMTEFGTLDDWKLMLKEIHRRGIKLIMDLVVNHTSDEHPWFQESKKSIDNPYRDYYIWAKGKGKDGKKPPNNWTSNFSGSAWELDPTTDEYYLHLFSKKQPDLNWDNPKVRKEVIDICNYWLELGVDGFRCDVIPNISKAKGYPNGKFALALKGTEHYVIGEHWEEYIRELNEQSWSKYDTLIVGECGLVPYDKILHISDETNGLLDTSFSFDAVTSDYLGFKLPKLKKIFKKFQSVPKTCWTSSFLENHDQPRCIPRFAKTEKYRDRAAAMLGTMIFMHRGTPYIYQGQEIGMTNCDFKMEDYKDIMSLNLFKEFKKLGSPFLKFAEKIWRKWARDNARTPMQWSDRANAGFTTGKPWMVVNPNYTSVNVEKDRASNFSVYEYYKALIEARKTVVNIISDGEYIDYCISDKTIYQYGHKLGNKILFTQLNFSEKNITVHTPFVVVKNAELIISNYTTAPKDSLTNNLKPFEAQVYLIEL